jgi:hypothetical protein
MKKIFTLLVALVAFSVVFAQHNTPYNNGSSNKWNMQSDNRRYDNNDYYNDRPDHAVVITNDNNRYQPDDHKYDDNYRRAEIERINRDYDRRINDYHNNRILSAYERDRYIRMAQKERNDKLKAFGGGVLLGGIVGVLIGSNL